jgi:hypothetical protein
MYVPSVSPSCITPSVSYSINNTLRNALPKADLLLYLARPNSDEYLIGEGTEVGEDTHIWGYFLGSNATVRLATGWTIGNANPFYDAAGDPIVVLATEIMTWPVINTGNVLFKLTSAERQEGKLAIYELLTPIEVITKAKQALRIS